MNDKDIEKEQGIQRIIKNINKSVGDLFKNKKEEAKNELDQIMRNPDLSADVKIKKISEIQMLFLISSYTCKVLKEFKYEELSNHDSFRLYFEMLFSIVCDEDYGEKLIQIADYYETRFYKYIDNNTKEVLILIKANSNSNMHKLGKAGFMYRECLSLTEVNSVNYAWCNMGLAKLCSFNDKRRCELLEKAREAFLLNGLQRNYIGATMKLIYFYKHYDLKGKRIKELFDELSYIDDKEIEMKNSILHEKAEYLNLIGRNEEALKCIWTILEGSDKSFGEEEKKLASIELGILISNQSQNLVALNKLKEVREVQVNHLKINDSKYKAYKQREEIASILMEKRFNDLRNLDLNKDNDRCDWLICVINSLASDVTSEDRIEYLEEALHIVEYKYNSNADYLEPIYFRFALEYINIDIEDSIKWAEKALELNPFNLDVIRTYSKCLLKIKDWERLLSFYQKQEKLWGEDDINIGWALGQVYYKMKMYNKSFKYLYKVKKQIPKAQEYFDNVVSYLAEKNEEIPYEKKETVYNQSHSVSEIYDAILDFSNYVSSEMRMSFWSYDKDKKKNIWIRNPEEHGKQLLQTFLKARFGNDIEIFPECIIGAGRIDIYIILKNNIKVTIELKMCGGGSYSTNYALEGFEQLNHYMKQKRVHVGYLVIFDGRIRDYSKDIPEKIYKDELNCNSIVIDVRPKTKNLDK